MSKINNIIPESYFELVRSKIASILADEFATQRAKNITAKAEEEAKPDPDQNLISFYDLNIASIPTKVFEERFYNPGSQELQSETIVNVMFTSAPLDQLQTITTQIGDNRYMIEAYCAARGKGSDKTASIKLHRILGIIRAVLMNPNYRFLELDHAVGSRQLQNLQIGQPNDGANNADSMIRGKIDLIAKVHETVEQIEGVLLEFTSTSFKLYDSEKGYYWTNDESAPVFYPLSIMVDGEGVTSPTEGTYSKEESTIEILTATPKPGFEFVKWVINTAEIFTPYYELLMDGNKSAKAFFQLIITSLYLQELPLGNSDNIENVGTGGSDLDGLIVSGSMVGKDILLDWTRGDARLEDVADTYNISSPLGYDEMKAINTYPYILDAINRVLPIYTVPTTLVNYFARPLGGSYGLEDGSSYENAWNGFANIDWGSINANETLWVCGTNTEQLTIGASGDSDNNIIVRGDYVGDECTINIEGQSDLYPLWISGISYVSVSGFDLIGNGNGAALGVYNASSSIIVHDTNVLRNYANDGFSLGDTSTATFYNITATKCREEVSGTGSHQCLTTHTDSSAIIYGATFSDSNYWFVNTLNSKIEAYGITANSSLIAGVSLGTDVTSSSYIKIYDSVLNVDSGGRSFSSSNSNSINAGFEIHNTEINITNATLSSLFSNTTFRDCAITVNSSTYRQFIDRGILTIINCNLELLNYSSYAYGINSNTLGKMIVEANNINAVGSVWCFRIGGIGEKSQFINNIVNESSSPNLIWVIDDQNAPIVANNTFYKSARGGVLIDLDHDGDEPIDFQLVFKNNICYNINDVIKPAAGAVYQESNNCFYNSENLGGLGDIIDNPLFIEDGVDFELQETSPCRKTAIELSTYYTTDYDGLYRTTWDMGAYWYKIPEDAFTIDNSEEEIKDLKSIK